DLPHDDCLGCGNHFLRILGDRRIRVDFWTDQQTGGSWRTHGKRFQDPLGIVDRNCEIEILAIHHRRSQNANNIATAIQQWPSAATGARWRSSLDHLRAASSMRIPLMIPFETVCSSPRGAPMRRTSSPTWLSLELARGRIGTSVASMRRMAMSLCSSLERTYARRYVSPVLNLTVISLASAITW